MCAREVALHVEKERYQYGTRKCLFKYILICFDANLVYSCKKKSEGNETRLWHKTSLRFFFNCFLRAHLKMILQGYFNIRSLNCQPFVIIYNYQLRKFFHNNAFTWV